MWNLKKKKKMNKLQTHRYSTDWWLPQAGSGGGVEKMGEGGQKLQIPVIRIMLWDVMCNMVTVVNSTALYICNLLRE